MSKYLKLPLIPLRGLTVFPNTTVHFDVARKKSVAAIEAATKEFEGNLLLVSQKSSEDANPAPHQIYTVGVHANIVQIINMPEGIQRVVIIADKKIRLEEYCQTTPYYIAEYTAVKDKKSKTLAAQAYFRKAKALVSSFSKVNETLNRDLVKAVLDEEDYTSFCYRAAQLCLVKNHQQFLEIDDLEAKYEFLIEEINTEIQLAKIERRINNKVRYNIDKGQKEYFLREQMKVINEELGEGDDENEYIAKIDALPIADEYKEKLKKDFRRSSNLPSSSPEYSLTRNYLDYLLELPWAKFTEDNNSLKNARAVLDNDHYGLEKIKERIIEFLAVRQLTDHKKEPIICLVGPPGVGKTSIVKSIASALGRKYIRMSLGGVHDEAEIRGHRRTYVGAMAGRIIGGIRQAGSANPVFLLDEIDKLASDYKGDPASALLEVLDPEQNNSFRDNYLEIPFDLSNVIFITTANNPDTIPDALYDRMEIIEMSGYTPDEKFAIAKKYLLPKQADANGIKPEKLELTDDAVMCVIERYTRESGVRGLEKQIAKIMRKVARKFVEEGDEGALTVRSENLKEYLGAPVYTPGVKNQSDEVGAATGLAWTSAGGDILTIEVSLIPGKGEILLTGSLGDVMKESARTAITFIRAHAKDYGIEDKLFKNNDIHIHVPEGAIPKDGPSAGITMATAVLSALTEKGVRSDVAMTGEITLRGKVLPIGGLKEKTLAAQRAGIKTVLIPEDNKKDIDEIPEGVRESVNLVFVKDMPGVFSNAIAGL